MDSSSDDEPLRMARREPRFQGNTNDFKVEILEFEGKLDPEEFLDWLQTIEHVFYYKDVPKHKKVKLVALRLRKYASLQVRERKFEVRMWEKMKSKLKARFLPPTYV